MLEGRTCEGFEDEGGGFFLVIGGGLQHLLVRVRHGGQLGTARAASREEGRREGDSGQTSRRQLR